MCMHISLRGRPTDFIRFSKWFKTSQANSIRNRQLSRSAGSTPVNIFPRHYPSLLEGNHRNLYSWSHSNFTHKAPDNLSFYHRDKLISDWVLCFGRPTDTQQGVPGGWLRRGQSAEWACLRLGTSFTQGVLTPPLASVLIGFKPGYGPQQFIHDHSVYGSGRRNRDVCPKLTQEEASYLKKIYYLSSMNQFYNKQYCR